MDPTKEIQYECFPVIRAYKDGTVERLTGSCYVPPGPDSSTRSTSKDVVIDPDTPVQVRLYLPDSAFADTKKLPILLYFHGGGFVAESAFSSLYHPFLSSLSARADILIVSVEYRLAPENPIPAAYNDCLTALKWAVRMSDVWLSDHGDAARVFLAGDSAGGNIVHNVALRGEEAGHDFVFEGLVLIDPYFWGTERMGSELEQGALLKPRQVDELWKFICGTKEVDNDDPRLNPLVDAGKWVSRMKCKKMLVCVAEKDVLRDRGRAYYERLRKSEWGGKIELFESEGADHVFFLFNPECDRAVDLMNILSAFFKSG